MKFESESQLSVRCFKCGCFGHRGSQCDDYMAGRGSQNLGAGGMLEKCWICGFLGHRAANCKEKTVTCFSCGERGHKQEDCCSPMANCWNCGKRGHIKKNCPVKTNVGMCFYCHEVGHHSKDCDKKVCYICQSKNHLWTRCPLKGTQGFPHSTSGYMRGMGYMPRGENQQKAIQLEQFPNQMQFDDLCYQSLEHQPQTPRCLRRNSMPVVSNHGITIEHERPMTLRTNSDPNGYSGYLNPLYRPRMSQSMDDFQLVPNLSSWSPVTPRIGNIGLRSDQDSSGFSMADIFSRSNESMMKMTESEKECRSVMPLLVGRRNSLVENCITPRSSEAWGDAGLHVVPWTQEPGSVTNPLSEKQTVTSQYNSMDSLSSEVNRSVVNTPSEKWELISTYDGIDLTGTEPKGLTMNKASEKHVVTSGYDAGDLRGYEAKGPLTKIGKKEVVIGGYNGVDPPCSEEKGSLPNMLCEKQSVTSRYDSLTLSKSEAKESIMSTLSEKHEGTNGYNDGDLPYNEKKKDCGETTDVNGRDGDTIPLQNQQTIQPAQETQASPDVVDAHDVAGTKTTVETRTNVINTNLSQTITSTSNTDNIAHISEFNAINTKNRSPSISSTLIKDRNVHTSVSVSTMSSVRQEDVKDQTMEVIVPEASVKTSNSLVFVKTEGVKTQVNDVQEDLERVREQLAEAKSELDEKREQLDKTKKIVEYLRNILFLESSFKKKSCPKNYQEEDLSSRCPNCIQILKNVESCEVCVCMSV